MKKILVALLFLCFSTTANAIILTFDDHPDVSQNSFGAIGTYGGFNFSCINCSNMNRLDWVHTVDSTWNYGAVSGEYTMLNNFGGIGVITAEDGSLFSFDGLWARVWNNTVVARQGLIEGYLNGDLIWTSNVLIDTTFRHLDGMAGNIDELRLDMGNFFLVDNLALNETPRSVSEPGTLALLGLSLVAMAVVRRRRI